VRTLHKMFGKSMLASICIIGALIIALFPAAVVGAGSSESGFYISQWSGETWEGIYQHQFEVQYSTEAFTVDVVDGKVALRIVQVGTPFADIDQISLMVDGEEITPEYARYTGSGQSILDDILELDNNVVLAHEQEIEVSWDVPAGNDCMTVYLTANEYGHGPSVRFPETGYATYEMGSNTGSITVDGLIAETDGMIPLYTPYWQSTSGHPDGYTYIYVCDDEEYVYFSLDVTGDNTNEYGEDWAEITILQPDGSRKAFRIDDYDNTWGTSGFGLTSKVSYKHQTCEFAIPKSIIGNENIEFTLAYYGTFAGDYELHPDSHLDIQIDGDSSEGQVFQVGDTIDITGLVSSWAAIKLYNEPETGQAYVYEELSVDGPSGYDYDWYEVLDEGTGNNYTGASIYYPANWTSLSYNLTHVGLHTITLYSYARVSGQTQYSGDVDVSDDAEITLDFWVGPLLSIDDVIVDEDAGNATFTVSLTSDPGDTVTVDYSTSDGTATAGSDYSADADTLTFESGGSLTQTIDVAIIDDALTEINETFYVTLTNATGEAVIMDDTGVGMIINDDPPLSKLFMVNGADPDWTELYYDDGEAVSGLTHGSPLGVWLVKFTPPAGESVKITDLSFWVWDYDTQASGDDDVKVIVFDKDGNQVYLSGTYDSGEGESTWIEDDWNSLDLYSESIPVMSDDFYIGIQNQQAYAMSVGYDDSGDSGRNYWAYPAVAEPHDYPYPFNTWAQDFMIRIEVEIIGGNEIVELDPDTGAVLNIIPTPIDTDGGGDGLAYGNGRMFFTTIDTDTIYEIDPSDGSVVNYFTGPVAGGEEGIDALGFSCDKLYALEYGPEPTIHILNPDTGATTGNLSPSVYLVGGGTFAGTRDSLFFSGDYEETELIYEINADTGAVINSFSPPVEGEEDGLYGLGFSSSRNTLFVGYYDSNMVYEVDPDDGTVINSFLGPEGAAISALAADEFVPGGTTCETFYSDGEVNLEAYNADYNTAHDAENATMDYTGSLWIGQDYWNSNYFVERVFLYIDTSAIPDGAVITSASLHLYGEGDDSDSDFSLVIVNGQPTYPHDPYELSDYDIDNYVTSPNGGELSTTGFVVDGYNTIEFSETGLGSINKTGTTKLGIFSSKDISGTAPFEMEYVSIGSSADEGHEPYLEVCYTTGGGDTPPVANDNSVGTAEDTSLTFAACNFPYTDVDGDARTAVKIMSLPAHGTLNYSGSTFTTPYIIDEADISNLTFEPAANEYGSPYATFGFQVQAGGAWSANTATMTIAVSPVNDEPSFTAGSNVTVDENSGAYSAAWACGISPGPSNESGQAVAFHLSNDNNSLFSSQPAISPTGTLTFTPAANVTGSAAVDVYLQDDGGTASGGDDTSATVQFTINVTPVNDCPVIDSVSPASQTVQFSDLIDPITIVASDADGDTLSLYGVPYGLNAVEGPTNTWNISGQFMDDHAMDWIIGVTDGECETPAATIASLEECVIVRFDNHNPMSVEEADAGDLTTAEFTVHIKQDPDGYLGWADLASGDVEMDIVPVGGGPTIDMDWVSNSDLDEFSEGAPVSFTFVPESGASFPIGTYIIEVTVNNDYYKVCGGAESLLMVYDPDVGASGSGTFEDCGDTYSFAFLVDYNKKGKNLRGSLVVIRELSGGGIYRIQSNALYDLALIEDSAVDVASFSGKCTYIGPDVLDDYGDPQNVGGQEFVVYLEDYDTSSGPSGTPDRFWFTVLGRDFTLDFDGDNQVSALEPQDLTSGDIIVPNSKPNMAKPKN
jgi:hypothetical protein